MKLYEYQKEVVDQAEPILLKNGLVLIHAEMRTGKTLMALELARRILGKSKCPQKQALFVSKKVALTDISINVRAYESGVLEGQIQGINYESVHKLSKKCKYQVIILDEYHTLGAYPKMGVYQKNVLKICQANPDAYYILQSGTSNVESRSQLFHPLRITGKFWGNFNNFYSWFKTYGVPKTMRLGPREVNVYTDTKADEVLKAIDPLCVSLTQEDAGFLQNTSVKPVYLENPRLVEMIDELENKQVMKVGNSLCVAPSAVSVLNKSLQICGATLKCENDEGDTVVEYLDESYKIDFIKTVNAAQVAIFTNFIAERDFIINALGDKFCTDDMDFFKSTTIKYFVGSLQSYSEGFDLSQKKNTKIVLYSICWSGSKFTQICERQQNKKRKESVEILCPILKNSPEEYLFKAVRGKQNFNCTFLRRAKLME